MRYLIMTLTTFAAAAMAPAQESSFQRDRAAILAMAGEFEVKFQFEEVLTLGETEPSKHHESGAFEWVEVIEDRGDFISLQHILMVKRGDDAPSVVKHWRQDWQFEDATVHAYQGGGAWAPVKAPASALPGSWTQTVFQVDDSPRYESHGHWRHIGDHSYWDSAETWRPLPRREHTKRSDYDVLVGRNRHAITPQGWVHQQDNYKLAQRDGGQQVLAYETGLNTYTRVADFDFAPARDYWESTKPYWAVVRAWWNNRYAAGVTIHLAAEHEGEPLMDRLLEQADEFAEGALEESLDDLVARSIAPYLAGAAPKQAAR
jgi:hypothetical protein